MVTIAISSKIATGRFHQLKTANLETREKDCNVTYVLTIKIWTQLNNFKSHGSNIIDIFLIIVRKN